MPETTTTTRHHLTIPRYWLSTFGRRAFSIAGPTTTVWNSLLDSLHDVALSSNSFRLSLKTNLFNATTLHTQHSRDAAVHSPLYYTSGKQVLQVLLTRHSRRLIPMRFTCMVTLLDKMLSVDANFSWMHTSQDIYNHTPSPLLGVQSTMYFR